MSRIELERLRFGITKAIDEDAFAHSLSLKAHVYRPENMRAVIIDVVGWVWAQDIGGKSFKWPKDWWQAIRERFLPAWWLERHPVLYHHKTFQVHAAYPTFRPPPGLDKCPMVWKVREQDWDDGHPSELCDLDD